MAVPRVRALIVMLLLVPLAGAQSPFLAHEDVVSRIDSAETTLPDWIQVQEVGASGEGRELQLVVVTDPTSDIPMEDRVVTLLLTQQHGNEPAGTPAVLDLLDSIAAGDPIAGTLHNQILLIQPMGNPDGATANQRANAAGTDLNRDHVHLAEPETQIVHGLFQDWDIHVGVDHHEYSGTGVGYPVPVNFYDFDATILYPRHGNVREPTRQAAMDLQYEGLFPAAEAAGYTAGDYGVQTAAGIPIDHLAGGPDPGILRNNFGLNNIAGLLVESYVPLAANPFITEERRVDVHRTIMEGTLEYVSANAQMFIDAKRQSERLNLEDPMTEYIEEWPEHPVTGQANTGNLRGPLAVAYQAGADEVMELHGLPAAVEAEEGSGYPIGVARGGLVAAILHPDSSRQVVASTPMDAFTPVTESVASEEAAPALAPLLALLAIALLARRLT